jgi:hypothetical protein
VHRPGSGPDEDGKHPVDHGWQHGGSKDPATLTRWFDTEGWNIGLLTGNPSQTWVLDIDSYAGGEDSLAELERLIGELPQTLESLTPGGGRHLFFRMPEDGSDIGNSVGILPGIDVKGTGGQVVIAPSQARSKSSGEIRAYEWEVSSGPGQIGIADTPSALLEFLRAQKPAYAKVAENGTIPEGLRHKSLTSIAGSMRRVGLTGETIRQCLHVVNRTMCVPPQNERDIESIADSAAVWERGEISIQGPTDENRCPWPRETLAAIRKRNPQAKPDILPGLLRKRGIAIVAGLEGSGKSFLLELLAARVSVGAPWLGFPTVTSTVGLVSLEMDAHDNVSRSDLLGEDPAWEDHVRLLTPDSMGTSILELTNPQSPHLGWLIYWGQGLDLIILDPKSNTYSDGEDQEGHKLLLRAIDRIIFETGAAIVLASHIPKVTPKEYVHWTRGDTTLTGAVQAMLLLTKHRGSWCLITGKSRIGERKNPRVYLETTLAGDLKIPITVRDAPLDSRESKQANVQALRAILPDAWAAPSVIHEGLSENGIKVAKSTFNEYLAELVEIGDAECRGHGRSTQYRRIRNRMDHPANSAAESKQIVLP